MFYNRGVSGDRISDLYARWNEDAFYLQPDILSILIGVNDIWRMMKGEPGGCTDRYERAYRHVLEETREVLPDTKLVLVEPFILNTGAPAEDWSGWSKWISHYQGLSASFHRSSAPCMFRCRKLSTQQRKERMLPIGCGMAFTRRLPGMI